MYELGTWIVERMFTFLHVSHVKCHMSHVMCHVSRVIYHESLVTFHMSNMTCPFCFLFFWTKWRSYLVKGLLSKGHTPSSSWSNYFFLLHTDWFSLVLLNMWLEYELKWTDSIALNLYIDLCGPKLAHIATFRHWPDVFVVLQICLGKINISWNWWQDPRNAFSTGTSIVKMRLSSNFSQKGLFLVKIRNKY